MTILLKVHIWRKRETVYMQVLEQAESLYMNKKPIFKNKNFELRPWGFPELRSEAVYVRGSDYRRDFLIAELNCSTVKNAKEYYKKLNKLFLEYKAVIIANAIMETAMQDTWNDPDIDTLKNIESIRAPVPEDPPSKEDYTQWRKLYMENIEAVTEMTNLPPDLINPKGEKE